MMIIRFSVSDRFIIHPFCQTTRRPNDSRTFSYAAFILLLFFQRSFKSPAGPKPRGITGGDVNRFAGPGVAPGSSLPVITIEGAKVHQ
jgi:hypothetical protein